MSKKRSTVSDLRGGLRLLVDGVSGVTGIVEAMHSRITRVARPVGPVAERPTRGITGLVYRSIQGTNKLVGKGLDGALALAEAGLQASLREVPEEQRMPRRDALVAALNGVMGDHLVSSSNPLAIQMQLRPQRPPAGGSVLLLIHGLCMNDQQWARKGHDHGRALAESLGYAAVYARYNTGQHISINGRDLAAQLEQLLGNWPEPLSELAIIGHSMGGLVARSALHQALEAGMAWPRVLHKLVLLGSPHHGAPLERGGNWLHRGLGVSSYAAPLTRLSGLRSAGITDLRHGNLLASDWDDDTRFLQADRRSPLPLPAGVACYAMAGSLSPKTDRAKAHDWLGDGLVPVASALGQHADASRDLQIPASHQWVARGVNHLDLLSDKGVYRRLRQWLAE
ncbi:MAG: alpha/beta hydrolase [Burkholderiaceae bacterium]|nr:alpha/beta hydrolase [Burkholderiaceae bacterium]